MEVIALILIVALVMLNGAKKGNRARQADRSPNLAQGLQNSKLAQAVKAADAAKAARAAQAAKQARTAQAAKPAQPAGPAKEAKLKNLRFVPLATPAEGGAMLADEDCHGGSMAHTHAEGASSLEDEDCFGGSMEHTHTEGVSRAEQARRMVAIDSAGGDEMLPERIDARTLRRAVVMAEVLGKPKALRGRP